MIHNSVLNAVRYAMRKTKKDSLAPYRVRRDIKKSSEPRGVVSKSKKSVFVVQRHNASHLHYDFRLSIDGVLKSWSVPKGIPLRSGTKRLAIMTDDHPLAYASFEGTIPEGSYGAGNIEIWDQGVYKNVKKTERGSIKSMRQCLKDGTLEVELVGEKLEGIYILVYMEHGAKKGNWLLMKKKGT